MLKTKYRNLISKIKEGIEEARHRKTVSEFKFADQDFKLTTDWPLDKNSVVFDVGGYDGNFTALIHDKFQCKVFVFEPHPELFSKLKIRFKEKKNIIPLNKALSDYTGYAEISDHSNASRISKTKQKEGIKCEVTTVNSVMREYEIETIDLMKINIEGSEFELFSDIFKNSCQDSILAFLVQFHNFVPNAALKRANILEQLSETHSLKWCFDFVWESWIKKD